MRILRITVQGLPLFKKELDISFFAQQRVDEDDDQADRQGGGSEADAGQIRDVQ